MSGTSYRYLHPKLGRVHGATARGMPDLPADAIVYEWNGKPITPTRGDQLSGAQSQPTVAPARLTAPYSPIPEGGFVTHASQCGDAPEAQPRPTIAPASKPRQTIGDLRRKIAQVERSVEAIAASGWASTPQARRLGDGHMPQRSTADSDATGVRVMPPSLTPEDEREIDLIASALSHIPRLTPAGRRELATTKYLEQKAKLQRKGVRR